MRATRERRSASGVPTAGERPPAPSLRRPRCSPRAVGSAGRRPRPRGGVRLGRRPRGRSARRRSRARRRCRVWREGASAVTLSRRPNGVRMAPGPEFTPSDATGGHPIRGPRRTPLGTQRPGGSFAMPCRPRRSDLQPLPCRRLMSAVGLVGSRSSRSRLAVRSRRRDRAGHAERHVRRDPDDVDLERAGVAEHDQYQELHLSPDASTSRRPRRSPSPTATIPHTPLPRTTKQSTPVTSPVEGATITVDPPARTPTHCDIHDT